MKFKLLALSFLLAAASFVSADNPMTALDRATFQSLFTSGYFGPPKYAAAPVTCSTATKHLEYYDTVSNTVKFCNGTSWGITGTGSTPALDNLASVNINTSLLAQTGVDLGSTTKPFRNLYLWGTGTYSTTYGKFTAAPTGTRTYTFPDANTTIPVFSQTITFTGPSAARSFALPDASDTIATLGQAETITGIKTFSAAPIATTGVDLGSTTAQFRNLYLFGAGTFSTTYLKLTGTPTSTRTITFPDATDTVAVLGAAQTITGIKTFSAAPIATTGIDIGAAATPFRDLYLSGSGAFGTTSLRLTGTPTGNRVVTIPDATDTVAELGQANAFTGINTYSATQVYNASVQGNFATFALTSGAAAATFVKVAMSSNTSANFLIEYVFEASTATPNRQAFGGIIGVNAVNVGGTITCTVGAVTTATQPALAANTGTLTNAITCADGTANVLNILATDTSSITPTTNLIRYRLRGLAGTTLTVTPQ